MWLLRQSVVPSVMTAIDRPEMDDVMRANLQAFYLTRHCHTAIGASTIKRRESGNGRFGANFGLDTAAGLILLVTFRSSDSQHS